MQKSVANHLNDIAKDHPDVMLDLVESWDHSDPHTAWIVRHGSRSLIKAGHPLALALQGFGAKPKVTVPGFVVEPDVVPWEGTVAFRFDLQSTAKSSQRLAVD